MPSETKYKILAYKKSGDTYIFDKEHDFTVGAVNPKIELSAMQNYTLLVVSTGNSASAKIEDANNINNVQFIPNTSTASFLYQRIENFIPSGDKNNVLNIKLVRSANVSVLIDINNLLEDTESTIEYVQDIKITYTHPKSIDLHNLSGIRYEETTLPIKQSGFLDDDRKLYSIDFHDAIVIDDNVKLKFYANIKVKDRPDISKIDGQVLPVKLWYKHTFTLNPVICGAYTASNKTNFREFMCQDLGQGFIWVALSEINMLGGGKRSFMNKRIHMKREGHGQKRKILALLILEYLR